MEPLIGLVIVYIIPCLISILTLTLCTVSVDKGLTVKFFVLIVGISLIPSANIVLAICGIMYCVIFYGIVLYDNFGDMYLIKPKRNLDE